MSNTITNSNDIANFRLRTLRSAIKLEALGLKKRGQSALSIARSMGYKGNRAAVIDALTKAIEG